MADTITTDFTSDPLFQVYTKMGEIETKISDSIFENYKLQVAQTNDINNRAMQTAFHTDAALAALKEAANAANVQNLLGIERLNSAVQLAAAHTSEVIMTQGQTTRAKIEDLNRQNLSRELTDRATEVISLREGLRFADSDLLGMNHAFQNATLSSQIATLGSQVQASGQGFVNTGTSTGTVQTSTPTNIG